MSITGKFRALVAPIAVLALGLAACQSQGTGTSIATDEEGVTPASWLAKPDGDGPFPAVVLMHGCSGIEKNTSRQTVWRGLGLHAALLGKNGYVTLIVDSFGPRRITDGCQKSYYSVQIRDAYAAFDHLASLPFVDGDRIGLVGLSLGGGTALRLAQRHFVDHRAESGRGTYAALVAYYPWCEPSWAYALDRPVLILAGAEDDWTPAYRCVALHARAGESARKPIVELEVYPDSHHAFDLPMQGPYYARGYQGRIHTVQGNAEARKASQDRMLAFFERHLGRTP